MVLIAILPSAHALVPRGLRLENAAGLSILKENKESWCERFSYRYKAMWCFDFREGRFFPRCDKLLFVLSFTSPPESFVNWRDNNGNRKGRKDSVCGFMKILRIHKLHDVERKTRAENIFFGNYV